jgi:hypothetical protein
VLLIRGTQVGSKVRSSSIGCVVGGVDFLAIDGNHKHRCLQKLVGWLTGVNECSETCMRSRWAREHVQFTLGRKKERFPWKLRVKFGCLDE